MKVCTTLSEDPESPSLNTKPHAREHCAVDGASLAAIDGQVGRQVLASLSPEQFALYTVTECIAGVARAAHVGSKGLARLAPDASPAPMPEYDATLETDFTGSGASALRLTEELLGDDTTGLAILAPHGGLIEIGTDVQARSAYTMLVRQGKPVRAWIAQGYNRVTGAHTCWHITSSEISEHSFPMLGALFVTRGFAHAVAFHGHNDSEAVVVGGGLPQDAVQCALKYELCSMIGEALAAVTYCPPRVEVKLSGPLSGNSPRNIVNRVTVRGNGLQVEQPLAVRDNGPQNEAIAHAVAALYADLV